MEGNCPFTKTIVEKYRNFWFKGILLMTYPFGERGSWDPMSVSHLTHHKEEGHFPAPWPRTHEEASVPLSVSRNRILYLGGLLGQLVRHAVARAVPSTREDINTVISNSEQGAGLLTANQVPAHFALHMTQYVVWSPLSQPPFLKTLPASTYSWLDSQ